MSESTQALGERTTAIAFDHTLYLCLYSYLRVVDPERVVAKKKKGASEMLYHLGC